MATTAFTKAQQGPDLFTEELAALQVENDQ
jgi:hypothetical protein